MIWKKILDVTQINKSLVNTMADFLDIKIMLEMTLFSDYACE